MAVSLVRINTREVGCLSIGPTEQDMQFFTAVWHLNLTVVAMIRKSAVTCSVCPLCGKVESG